MDLSLIKKFLADLLEKMQIEFSEISVEEEGGVIYANIETAHAALLIGKNGQNLDALQHLLKVIIFRSGGEKVFLLVDVENFRRKKNDETLKTARQQAEAVRETGVSQILPPMSPFLRRLVHLELTKKEFENLQTESFGDGTARRIRISLR